MLTQGPTPDANCELIISSLLTLPHLLHCLNCTRNAMVIVFIVITSRRVWDRWAEVDLCYGVGYHLIVFVINSKFSSDCNVTSLDQSNLLVIDNNSFDYISSEPSLLDCQIVLDDVFKPDYT